MRVLIVNPPMERHFHWAYPPIGLAYLKAYLADRHQARVVDMAAYDWPRVEETIRREDFDVIGISAMTNSRMNARRLGRLARRHRPGCRIVLGGPHPSSFPEEMIASCQADAAVIGEGEISFRELVDAYEAGRDPSGVPGIVFRGDGGFVRTPGRPLIADLNAMPRPDFSDLDLPRYGKALMYLNDTAVQGLRLGNLLTSRGCPFKCDYCSTSAYWSRKFRPMSPKTVVDQMEWLRDAHGVGLIVFMDDLFTVDRKRVVAICQEILRRRLEIPWIADARVDTVDAEELRWMKRAGCFGLFYGLESGSARILRNIHKEATLEETARAIRATQAAGIKAWGFLMIGNPGETLGTVRETFEMWKALQPDGGIGAVLTVVFPDAPLYRLAKEKGVVDDDYWKTDRFAPVYTGDHSFLVLRLYQTYLYALWALHKLSTSDWKGRWDISRRVLRYFRWKVQGLGMDY